MLPYALYCLSDCAQHFYLHRPADWWAGHARMCPDSLLDFLGSGMVPLSSCPRGHQSLCSHYVQDHVWRACDHLAVHVVSRRSCRARGWARAPSSSVPRSAGTTTGACSQPHPLCWAPWHLAVSSAQVARHHHPSSSLARWTGMHCSRNATD